MESTILNGVSPCLLPPCHSTTSSFDSNFSEGKNKEGEGEKEEVSGRGRESKC